MDDRLMYIPSDDEQNYPIEYPIVKFLVWFNQWSFNKSTQSFKQIK